MSPTFQNPVIRGFNPDPTVCVVRNATVPEDPRPKTHYYLSTSTFEYFPGCAVYHSTDLINWDLIGHALTRRSQIEMRTVEPGAGSWASTLRYNEREERFYLANGVFQRYRPASDERIFPRGFYVWTDNIWKPDSWSDPVHFDNPGFDQDLFWDDATSKVYLSTTTRLKDRQPSSVQKDFAIHISEIDLPTGRTLTPPVVIRKSHHGIAEGSHIFRRGEYHYLLTAEGGTEAGHQEWIFRSRKGVHGPWEDRGQALWYNGPTEEVQRTGHVDIFEGDEGAWWGVFLGVRPVRVGVSGDKDLFLEPQMGRETFLVKVDWVDDWPVFNDGGNITLETKGRGAVRQLVAQIKPGDMKWTADLSKEGLELGWYQKRESACATQGPWLTQKARYAPEEMLHLDGTTGLSENARQLLRLVVARGAGDAAQETVIVYRGVSCQTTVQPYSDRIRGWDGTVVESVLICLSWHHFIAASQR
ncbi:beta-xylosidase [Seiridium cupressi]